MKKTIASLKSKAKNLKPEQVWAYSLAFIGVIMFMIPFFGWDLSVSRIWYTGYSSVLGTGFNWNPELGEWIKTWSPIPANMLLIAAYIFLIFRLAKKLSARLYLIPLLALVAISVLLNIPQMWGIIHAKAPEFSKSAVLLSSLSLLGVTALGYIHRSDGTVRLLLFVVLMHLLIPALAVNGVLKHVMGRPRPVQTQQFGGPAPYQDWYAINASQVKDHKSFASGHAANAALLLTIFFLSRGFPLRQRIIFVVLSLVWWFFVSMGRMITGAHYLSDTLASLWLTIFFGGVLAKYWLKPGKWPQPALTRS